jgi:subtilisin family serine protease
MATKAYAWTSTGSGVDVYVVDSGIQAAHTEFANGNVAAGVDYAGGDGFAPTNPCGGFGNYFGGGHGTAVASAIGGRTVGVARGATLIPVKVFSCDPNKLGELTGDTLGVLYGLDWILSEAQSNPTRRAVVNMSMYFDGFRRTPPAAVATGTVDQL